MKNSISKLGVTLDKEQQSKINGGGVYCITMDPSTGRSYRTEGPCNDPHNPFQFEYED